MCFLHSRLFVTSSLVFCSCVSTCCAPPHLQCPVLQPSFTNTSTQPLRTNTAARYANSILLVSSCFCSIVTVPTQWVSVAQRFQYTCLLFRGSCILVCCSEVPVYLSVVQRFQYTCLLFRGSCILVCLECDRCSGGPHKQWGQVWGWPSIGRLTDTAGASLQVYAELHHPDEGMSSHGALGGLV
jgi:hypothetical protein